MGEEIIRMSKKELKRLEIIYKVIEKKIKQKDAAEILSLSVRQVRRVTKKVKIHGAIGIVHGNRGRESKRKFPSKFREKVIEIVEARYYDFGPKFASEKLEENEGLRVSRETLRKWMIEEGIWIPRKLRIREKIHQWRKRKECFGEMVLTDGSEHDWLEGRGKKMVLMAYIDDATNNVFARFYPSETTYSAMHSFKMYIEKYGIPMSLYFDRNSIYKTTRQPTLDESLKGEMPKTQFEKVLEILNVEPIYAYSPQAKGRIERLFKTFQDRLIKEMRLAGISTLDEANKFLERYLPKYNSIFSFPPANPKNLHREVPVDLELEWVFAFREERVITNDFTVSWRNRVFLIKNPSIALKRRRVTVMENLKGEVRIWFNGRFLEFEEITKATLREMRRKRKHVEEERKEVCSKRWKPGPTHPWRLQNKVLFEELKR